jgi:hypothetical protein
VPLAGKPWKEDRCTWIFASLGLGLDLVLSVDGMPRKKRNGFMRNFRTALMLTPLLFLVISLILPGRIGRETIPIAFKRFAVDKLRVADGNLIDRKVYLEALRFFNSQRPRIRNRNYLTIIDYSKPSFKKRMYIINLKTGDVQKHFVAHGKNSGHIMAVDFSNEEGSLKSSRGYFLTGKEYIGSHGASLVLHGLERGVNDNAVKRGIVIHGADYVSLRSVLINGGRLGRSWGCPALPLSDAEEIIGKIKNGSLLYIHGNQGKSKPSTIAGTRVDSRRPVKKSSISF